MKTTMTTDQYLDLFEKRLSECLISAFSNAPVELKDSAFYACCGGGKRIRPMLCYLSAVFCGVDLSYALDYALPIELIHSYSLVHDDLPCMDNDDFRRGKPTVHKQFGEAIALLCGDALLNLAYERLSSSVIDSPAMANGAHFIASYAGTSGMIAGQAREYTVKKPPVLDEYLTISNEKTAALITASVLAPATLSYDTEKISAITMFGKNLGLCFQLTDDLLDKDKDETTSVLAVVNEYKAKRLLDKHKRLALRSVEKFGEDAEPLVAFLEKICSRNQ